MKKKRNINFGFRGWMLILYQAIAFVTYQVFTNYPLNILADFYGGAQTLSKVYSICAILGIFLQIALGGLIPKMKNLKAFSSMLGAGALLLGLGIMTLPAGPLWMVCYALENVVSVLYASFSVCIIVGQWFPTRKGTVMGIATFAFPIANGLIGPFAVNVFAKGYPDIPGAFMPFFIVFIIGWLIGLIFVKDYPEQCGAYRDNDKSLTPEVAQAMMEEEIRNKKTSVWTLGKTLRCGDFWLLTIPAGFLLMIPIGTLTQSAAIIGNFEEELAFLGGYTGVMFLIMIFGLIGSFLLGVLDTRLGTRKAMQISVVVMIIAGILGTIPNAICLLLTMICLGIFMGAASNFGVSLAAQYWRREDFGRVFAISAPIGGIINAAGPMIVAMLLYSTFGYRSIFVFTVIVGVLSLILLLLFKPERVKLVDDKYRTAAGKPLDDALVGRK